VEIFHDIKLFFMENKQELKTSYEEILNQTSGIG